MWDMISPKQGCGNRRGEEDEGLIPALTFQGSKRKFLMGVALPCLERGGIKEKLHKSECLWV